MSTTTLWARWVALFPLLLAFACSPDHGSFPTPTQPPAPTSSTSAPPEPSPPPAPPPGPPDNRPPTVTLRGGGSCHPSAAGSFLGEQACSVGFSAEVRDPDGDRIELRWGGCASGNGLDADCVISRPGIHEATLVVSDGRGGRAEARKTAEGINHAPVIGFGSPRPPDPAPSDGLFFIVGGQPTDPDGDEEENRLCSRTTLTASGPCSAAIGSCGGVGDAFDVDLRTTTGPGTCVLEAKTFDSWGLEGRARLLFEVSAP